MLAVDRHALERLSAGRAVSLVSGTNGKTTTARMLATALRGAGAEVVGNEGGANMPSGIVTCLARAREGAAGVLEVDEAWLPKVAVATTPRTVTLLNLSRDQLDRASEVRMLAARWREHLARDRRVVTIANADDPLVAWAAATAARTVWVAAGSPWREDAHGCPACGGSIEFGDTAGGDGDAAGGGRTAGDGGAPWRCGSCAHRRPQADWVVAGGALRGPDGSAWPVRVALPGRCNISNAAMAAVTAAQLGTAPDAALAAIATVDSVAGRYRTVRPAWSAIGFRLLLAKNPAGWGEALEMLAPAPRPVVCAINARIADGRDPSWLWDVPFERLQGRFVVATGERCRDLALRLRYAEVTHEVSGDLRAALSGRALQSAARGAGDTRGADGTGSAYGNGSADGTGAAGNAGAAVGTGDGIVDVVANYTSFQQLARVLALTG